MDNQTGKKSIIGPIIVVVVMILLGLLVGCNAKQCTFLNALKGNPKGALHIGSLLSGTKIFIDNEKKTITEASELPIIFKDLKAETHEILVGKDGYWPWIKKINLAPGTTTTVLPFMVQQNPIGQVIRTVDPEYKTYVTLINQDKLPTSGTKKLSKDNKVSLFVENGAIKAEWVGEETIPYFFCNGECSDVQTVITPQSSINSLDFYGDRNDVLIFSDQSGIYAIELDKRGTQNFQPVYSGKDIKFLKTQDGSFYLLDAGKLVHIIL